MDKAGDERKSIECEGKEKKTGPWGMLTFTYSVK